MSSAKGAASIPRVEGLLLVVALAEGAVVLLTRYLPYVDFTNHLARYVVMERWLFGEPAADVEMLPRLSPYLGLDALGVTLVHFLPVQVAGKSIALLALLMPGLGLYVLLRAACPERRGWAVLGLLLGFNRYYLIGLFYYQIAIGLSLVWLGLWVIVQNRPRGWNIAALMLLGCLLDFIHLSALVTLGAVVGAQVLWRMASWRNSTARSISRLRPLWLAVIGLGPAAALMLLMAVLQLKTGEGAGREFRSVGGKIFALYYPFYTLSWMHSGLLAAAYVTGVAAFAWSQRRTLRFDGFALAVLVLLLLYAIFPVGTGGTYDLDVRFLLPAQLLVPAIGAMAERSGEAKADVRFGPLLLAGSCSIVVAAATFVEARQIDVELSACAEVLAEAPDGNVLPLIAEPSRLGVPIYQHFAHWHTIGGRGRAPLLFAAPETPFYEHLRLTRTLYSPPLHWGVREAQPLDDALVVRDYGAILFVGSNAEALEEAKRHGRICAGVGKSVLLIVGK